MKPSDFSNAVLHWFDRHGRHDLPWQKDISPYRVWLSEIMLQQTQVATVIPYFLRFIEQLPTIKALAEAEEDTVLHLWTGLGYYARARNLHKTAKLVCEQWDGVLPGNLDDLQSLPGIGRSTAGAVLSIAFRKRAAILDGNVKRVLARHEGIEGWPGASRTLKELWEYAEKYTPSERVWDYSQAMMDMGATLCTRSRPRCNECPLQQSCFAFLNQQQTVLPGKKPRKILPVKSTAMLMLLNPEGAVLLEKRPAGGIWGGLWAFPEFPLEEESDDNLVLDTSALRVEVRQRLDMALPQPQLWDLFRHTFSHYHLDIQPVLLPLVRQPRRVMEGKQQIWYNLSNMPSIGLAAPVKRLLAQLQQKIENS